MKGKSFRGRGGELKSDEDYFLQQYNESSSFSNDLMKQKRLRGSGGGGGELNSGED